MGRHRPESAGANYSTGVGRGMESLLGGLSDERATAHSDLLRARAQSQHSIDPFRIITGTVVSFMFDHLGPLKKLMDYVTCNTEAVDGVIQQWEETIPNKLEKTCGDLTSAGESLESVWSGDSTASDAFQEYFDQRTSGAGAAVLGCKAIGVALDLTKSLMEMLQTVIKDQIAKFLANMIERGLIELVTWVFPPAGAAATAEFIIEWTGRMYSLCSKLTSIIQGVLSKLRGVTSQLGKLGDLVNFIATMKTAGVMSAFKSQSQVMGASSLLGNLSGRDKIAKYATTQISHYTAKGVEAAHDAITGDD